MRDRERANRHTREGATLMTWTTSAEAYERYRRPCGGAPVLSEGELRAEIRAAGLRHEGLNEAFWAALLRRPDQQHVA